MKNFITFIREQGVVGLSIGFILGGAISKLVASLVSDIIDPILSIGLKYTNSLDNSALKIGEISIMWGSFVKNLLDFVILALVVYMLVKVFKVDQIDKKKS
jgi:large conductance mechanosensitive channel